VLIRREIRRLEMFLEQFYFGILLAADESIFHGVGGRERWGKQINIKEGKM